MSIVISTEGLGDWDPAAERVWSPQQQDIFDYVDRLMDNPSLMIIARAGCGKTTTIVECALRLLRWRVLFCAFNTSVAEELRTRLPHSVDVRTTHSLGKDIAARVYGSTIDKGKGEALCRTFLLEREIDPWSLEGRRYRSQLRRLVALSKAHLAMDVKAVAALAYEHQVVSDDDNVDRVADWALELCRRTVAKPQVIDFDDMIYIPLATNASSPRYKFDVVIVDEAQDLNPAQIKLVQSVLRPTGKMIVVGDDRQAIYGWRGADRNAMAHFKSSLGANTLPLTTTYRCASRIVALAQEYVQDFTAAEDAKPGTIEVRSGQELLDHAVGGDFILSRKNAPLVSLCLRYLVRNKPARIIGRDIGEDLLELVERAGAVTVEGLLAWVAKYKEREEKRLRGLDREDLETQLEALGDRCSCLEAIADGAETMEELRARCDYLFVTDVQASEDHERIVLSTVHRAKGLERVRVWILANTFKAAHEVQARILEALARAAVKRERTMRWDETEEQNIWYVGLTRAKRALYFVHRKSDGPYHPIHRYAPLRRPPDVAFLEVDDDAEAEAEE